MQGKKVMFLGMLSLLVIVFSVFRIAQVVKEHSRIEQSQGNQPQSVRDLSQYEFTPHQPAALTLADARRQHEEAYRLKPDSRCLIAVAEIDQLVTGKEKQQSETVFRDGKWHIKYGGEEVGELSYLADLEEMINMLTAWAKNRLATAHIQLADMGVEETSAVDDFSARHAFATLMQANEDWKQKPWRVSTLRRAFEALTTLAVQTLSEVGAAELLEARPLALLAVLNALDQPQQSREVCMIAEIMGYQAYKDQCVASLSPDDPFRLFTTRKQEQLQSLAQIAPWPSAIAYFDLQRASQVSQLPELASWVKKHEEVKARAILLLLQAFLQSGIFEVAESSARGIVEEALSELAQWSAPPQDQMPQTNVFEVMKGAHPSQVVPQLENFLDQVRLSPDGPFLDRRLIATHYRSYCYSALFELGLFYLDRFSSVEAVQQFNELLGTHKNDVQTGFLQWYQHLADSKAGIPNLPVLLTDLRDLSLTHMQGTLLFKRTFDELVGHLDYGSVERFAAARYLAARLDSRPSHRVLFATVARQQLLDLALAEALHESCVQVFGRWYSNLAWYYYLTGNRAALENMLLDPFTTPSEAIDVLGQLKDLPGVSAEQMIAHYEALVQRDPGSWKIVGPYTNYLLKQKHYGQAEQVITAWLNQPQRATVFDEIFARSTLAKCYLEMDKPAEALLIIEPAAKSWQEGALHVKAQALARLGRFDDAQAIAEAAQNRYRDSAHSLSLRTQIAWERKDYSAAAKLLANPPLALARYCQMLWVRQRNERILGWSTHHLVPALP